MTLIIIIITVLVSWRAFSDPVLRGNLLFIPAAVEDQGQWYRFITHGFIHADFNHLLFNMYALYIFGGAAEYAFEVYLFGPTFGKLAFLLFYLAALVASSYPDFVEHKNNKAYASLGASGAVAATMWPYIVFDPWNWFIFPPVPAIVLGIGYIAYSHYADKKGGSNIGHGAHLWGAVFGLVVYFGLLWSQNPAVLAQFVQALMQPHGPNF